MNLDLIEFILEIYSNEIKDGEYIINFDNYSNIVTYWISLQSLNKNVTYFDSFDNILYIFQKKSRNLLITKASQQMFFRIQAYNSAMFG